MSPLIVFTACVSSVRTLGEQAQVLSNIFIVYNFFHYLVLTVLLALCQTLFLVWLSLAARFSILMSVDSTLDLDVFVKPFTELSFWSIFPFSFQSLVLKASLRVLFYRLKVFLELFVRKIDTEISFLKRMVM